MNKNRKWSMRVLLLLAAAAIGFSGWTLWTEARVQRESDEQMDLKPQPLEDDPRLLDFGGLLAQYPDLAAWLTIDGTMIDYPVVQAGDNSYYLDHTAQNVSNKKGALFMDYRNRRDCSDFNTVVYGHSMRLRSEAMFGGLPKFKEKAYFDSHKTGTLYTPEGTWPLEIFAVAVVEAGGAFYDYAFDSPASRQAHLDMIAAKAIFYRDIGAAEGDRLLTLSTCSYEFQEARTVVIARIAA